MDYLLFTYPNCDKCEAFKTYLRATALQGQELNLAQKESKLRVREFLDRIKRDESGAMILPIFVLREDAGAVQIFNNHMELDGWLKSRA
jgi:arsenate reductase-like glutaredoxin family protein